MGNFIKMCRPEPEPKAPPPKSKVSEADVIKAKLKKTRDFIQNFIDAKEKQQTELYSEIMKNYEAKYSKKRLIPLLQTRKDIGEIISAGNVRLTAIVRTIRDLEMQQINVEMVQVLDDSNKYMQKVQEQLEQKDWRGILEQAKEKYDDAQWQTQDVQKDPDFQALWKQLGGDKMDEKFQQQVQPSNAVGPSVIQIQDIRQQEQQEEQMVDTS